MKLSEFLTELNNRITASKVSGFWTDAAKEQWIYESIVRVCNYKNWKCLENSTTDSTVKDQESYTYPTTLKDDSVFLIEKDDKEYIKASWDDYREYKEEESDEKVFGIFDAKIYINPIPTAAGSSNMTFWGYKKPIALATWKTAADDSVLSEKFDESVIKLAVATALKKAGKYNEAAVEIAEVETPANPRIEKSGGLLAKLAAGEEAEGPKGYIGKAKSTRFMM